jgi:dynactin complex subunit
MAERMAEKKKYDLNTLEEHYNELERQMLDEFFEFVSTHDSYDWLHWNMRDINYESCS